MTLLITLFSFTAIFFVHGIPVRPKSKSGIIPFPLFKKASETSTDNKKPHLQGSKYPLYMMQLYKTLLMGNAADISILEKQVLQESDTVLSLIAKSCTEVGNNWTLSFDISSLHTSNELRLAELRIHLPSFEKSHNVTVNLFHTRKDHERHFLGSFKTDPFTPGSSWKVFNLTKMLQCYLNQGETCTVGEYIEAKDMTHIVSATNSRKTRTDDHSSGNAFTIDRVMLVVFAKDKAPIHHSPSHNKEKHSNIMADHATRVASIWRHRRKISV